MKTLKRLWDSFWFGSCDPLSAAVCRIALGLLLLVSFTGMSQNWDRFFAADGILSLNDHDLDPRRNRFGWNVFAMTEGIVPTFAWWYFGYASLIAMILGWRTRVATACVYIIICSIVHRNTVVVNGEEMVARFLLLYGMFSPWGNALSLDAYFRRKFAPHAEPFPNPLWPIRLMQVNVMLIYVISLPNKFAQDIGWITGDAMHWTVSGDMWWMRNFLPEITLSCDGWIRRLLTWNTVLIEGLVPVGVCFRRTRLISVFAMMSLHLGIAALVPGVTLFTLSMVVSATLFVDPEFYRSLPIFIGRWFTSRDSFRLCAAAALSVSPEPRR